ncbi:unnamed protein product [Vicia faba]|uniref:Uncharacterized protein n=1 Tax=Vicia faba TaxID=3906 RepID=A0AAV1ARQ1_VICFA|nr:unnamed protein product [Vicia faba]
MNRLACKSPYQLQMGLRQSKIKKRKMYLKAGLAQQQSVAGSKSDAFKTIPLQNSAFSVAVHIHGDDEGVMADKTWFSKKVISLKRSTGVEGKQHVEFC